MPGVYFIAAGQSSRNREKSLDKSLPCENISELLSNNSRREFLQHRSATDVVYAWGANRVGDLNRLEAGDFVVDVRNKKVVQVFRFVYWIETEDTRLQEYIGWDTEKSKDKRRPYKIVYFLTDPMRTIRTQKVFFQKAFAEESNQNWLVGQKWYSPSEVQKALSRTFTNSIEELLGVNADSLPIPRISEEPSVAKTLTVDEFERPTWLNQVIDQIEELRNDLQHQERDHEDLVSRFFEQLGYKRGKDIKYRRGRIDVMIQLDNTPLIVIEVKRDWSLSRKSKDYVQQAFNYALNEDSRYVAITNGDRYVFYDQSQGVSYDKCFIYEFQLTRLHPKDIDSINKLRPVHLMDTDDI